MDTDKIFVDDFLKKSGENITILDRLAGGVASSVWAGNYFKENITIPCVVKFTKDRPEQMSIPFNSRIDHFVSGEGHNLDTEILLHLGNVLNNEKTIVPKIFLHYPKERITVMEDLSKDPYNLKLFAHDLAGGIENKNFGLNLGKTIAQIQNVLLKNTLNFLPTEGAREQFEERGQSALFVFHNLQKPYKKFLEKNVKNGNSLVLTDVHPKNLFFGADGTCAVIDYGRTTYGDPQFSLPNFLSHIFLTVAIDILNEENAFNFIDDVISEYSKYSEIVLNEEDFCFYVGIEILGRSCGRWVNYLDEEKDIEKKTALLYLGQFLLTKDIKTIKELKDSVLKTKNSLLNNKFAF